MHMLINNRTYHYLLCNNRAVKKISIVMTKSLISDLHIIVFNFLNDLIWFGLNKYAEYQ